jgi:hypothetical protein
MALLRGYGVYCSCRSFVLGFVVSAFILARILNMYVADVEPMLDYVNRNVFE